MGTEFLLILIVLLAFTGCKGTEIGGSWAEKPITIDGDFRDWENHPTLLLEEQNAVVGQCNDSENLYLLFRTSDPSWAMAIQRTGLTLYLDPKGKKNKDFMICYKDGPARGGMPQTGMDQNRQRPERPQNDQGDRPEQDRPLGESAKPEFTCAIRDFLVEKAIPLDGSEGPTACFDTCFGFYTYEFKIPLKQSQPRFYGLGIVPGQVVGLGAVWGDMGDMPERPGGRSGGPGGGMGGGPPGGGMGGGRGGSMGGPPGGANRPDMPEKQEVWFKAPLSTNTPTAEEK
ncbi:MAG: hypothetical protein JW763_09380 [candidate division Zixibacteria bacterium]|nr:hypothetical protein [candidate division Zixibacteria bacterium]